MNTSNHRSSTRNSFGKAFFAGGGILVLFTLIFAAPLFITGWNGQYGLALGVSVLCLITSFAFFGLPGAPPQVTRVTALELTVLALIIFTCVSIFLIFDLGTGITDRSLARIETTNVNSSISETISASFTYLQIGLAAALLAWARRYRRHVALIFALAFSAYLLAQSGTRFYFLLVLSPIVYRIFLNSHFVVKIIAIASMLAFSTYIAIARTVVALSLEDFIFYDLPSTASYIIISQIEPHFANIIYFVVANFLVFIPRSIFPMKPVDEITLEFMIPIVGQARYDSGSTYLPGFLGSAWLYGGFIGVVIFSLLLGWLLIRAISYKVYDWKSEAIASLMLVGAILQFRNISVFYFLPLIYLIIVLKFVTILRYFSAKE